MKKIALFCDSPVFGGGGGVYSYCVALKELLESKGMFKVTLFCDYDFINFKQAKIYSLKQIKSYLKSDNFDYIHINGFMTLLPFFVYYARKQLNLTQPLIYTPHAHPFYTLNHPFRNRIFYHLFVKKILKKAEILISINNEDHDFFSKLNKNVIKIPHWIRWEQTNIQIKKEVSGKKNILFVGRNDPNKNLSFLYNLPENIFNVTCVTNLPPERKDFTFKQNLSHDELIEEYKKTDLLIVPSRYEAFSLTSLEALSLGKPILISDRVRIADWLDNVSGVSVFKYNDFIDFSEKLKLAFYQKVCIDNINKVFSKENAYNLYSILFSKSPNQKSI